MRFFTVTNVGTATAQNITLSPPPALPLGTTIDYSSCANLAANATCTIELTPGSTSGDSGIVLSIMGTNTNTLSATAYVLDYGSHYQESAVFSFTDTTPPGQNAHGTGISLVDVSAGVNWAPSPSTTGATSLLDAATNTADIVNSIGAGSYAASLCTSYSIDSDQNSPCSSGSCYTNWVLPAICELGGFNQGAGCIGGGDSISGNLPTLLSGNYWSSTENDSSSAWVEGFAGVGSAQANDLKSASIKVRCLRDF